MVSVIVTTHNRKVLLKRAVESVLLQTFTDYECIIVDDASDDGTALFLESINDKRFRYIVITKEESKGGNYARNLGIKNSMGEYIAFLDDDDVWQPKKLELQVAFLDKHKDAGLVYCQIVRDYVKEGLKKEIIPEGIYRGDCSKKIFTNIPCVTSTIMVRREILFEVGLFDENMKFWQEYDLCIRICQVTKIDYVKRYLATICDDHGDKHRLTNKLHEWMDTVKYQNQKYKKQILQLSDEMKSKRRLLIYGDAVIRSTNSGNMRARRYFLRRIWKETNKTEDFYRYLFNRK